MRGLLVQAPDGGDDRVHNDRDVVILGLVLDAVAGLVTSSPKVAVSDWRIQRG
jgi:hypothetical protein